jgi:hypothetical protein
MAKKDAIVASIDDHLENAIRNRMLDLLAEAEEGDPDTVGDGARAALRWLQWEHAKSGDVSMLIHLGKQYLGQQDRLVVEFEPARKTAPVLEADPVASPTKGRRHLRLVEAPEPAIERLPAPAKRPVTRGPYNAAKRRGLEAAIAALYPHGLPVKLNKDLVTEIGRWVVDHEYPKPHDRNIDKYLERLRKS